MIELFKLAPYALMPITCGLIVIVVSYMRFRQLQKAKYPKNISVSVIWLMGLIAFLFGLLGQVFGIVIAFDSITQDGDISATMVAEGIKSSITSTLIGLVVLIISLIIWGILKEVKQKRLLPDSVN